MHDERTTVRTRTNNPVRDEFLRNARIERARFAIALRKRVRVVQALRSAAKTVDAERAAA